MKEKTEADKLAKSKAKEDADKKANADKLVKEEQKKEEIETEEITKAETDVPNDPTPKTIAAPLTPTDLYKFLAVFKESSAVAVDINYLNHLIEIIESGRFDVPVGQILSVINARSHKTEKMDVYLKRIANKMFADKYNN